MMTTEEFSEFLESIGGLIHVGYKDERVITNAYRFDYDSGWNLIIKELIEDLIELGWDKNIVQIKEKFGGLRFYIQNGSNEMYKRIVEAENQSYETCETCGEKGEIRRDIGWWMTLCETHYNEKKLKYEQRNTNP